MRRTHSWPARGHWGPSQSTSLSDRRTCCRYVARVKLAVLIWTEAGREVAVPARFVDVSMDGCRLTIRHRRRPRPDGAVVLRVIHDAPGDPVTGILLSAGWTLFGRRTCRVRFISPLTFQTFKLLVNGPDLHSSPSHNAPEHESDWIWR